MKLIKVAMAPVILIGTLAGCSEPPTSDPAVTQSGSLSVEVIQVNGRSIACVVFREAKKGGVSCDFTREASK